MFKIIRADEVNNLWKAVSVNDKVVMVSYRNNFEGKPMIEIELWSKYIHKRRYDV